MNPFLNKETNATKEKQKKRRKHLAEHIDEATINYLEERFQTNLPCFQGVAGQYDPLDAMRRDAYREVILWLKHEISLAKKED